MSDAAATRICYGRPAEARLDDLTMLLILGSARPIGWVYPPTLMWGLYFSRSRHGQRKTNGNEVPRTKPGPGELPGLPRGLPSSILAETEDTFFSDERYDNNLKAACPIPESTRTLPREVVENKRKHGSVTATDGESRDVPGTRYECLPWASAPAPFPESALCHHSHDAFL
jgi:hypothetical protein